jgi:hypothetical protein
MKRQLIGLQLIGLAAAAALAASSGAALAQGWKEYAYPELAFTVSFPAEPKVETRPYQLADGRSVDAQVFSVGTEGGLFTVTVADLSEAGMDENAVLDGAIQNLSHGGEIKLNIRHRVGRVFGRQLSVAGADGSHSADAVFYYKNRLYQIEGKALEAGDGGAEAIRFQQSLVFTGGEGNRNRAGDNGTRPRGGRRDRQEQIEPPQPIRIP